MSCEYAGLLFLFRFNINIVAKSVFFCDSTCINFACMKNLNIVFIISTSVIIFYVIARWELWTRSFLTHDCNRGEDDDEMERRLVDDTNRRNLIPWDLNCGGSYFSTEQKSRGRHAHACTHAARAAATAPDPRSTVRLFAVACTHIRTCVHACIDYASPLR